MPPCLRGNLSNKTEIGKKRRERETHISSFHKPENLYPNDSMCVFFVCVQKPLLEEEEEEEEEEGSKKMKNLQQMELKWCQEKKIWGKEWCAQKGKTFQFPFFLRERILQLYPWKLDFLKFSSKLTTQYTHLRFSWPDLIKVLYLTTNACETLFIIPQEWSSWIFS